MAVEGPAGPSSGGAVARPSRCGGVLVLRALFGVLPARRRRVSRRLQFLGAVARGAGCSPRLAVGAWRILHGAAFRVQS
eukprot:11205918-Lingulodinium_polyedra.AAC.1